MRNLNKRTGYEKAIIYHAWSEDKKGVILSEGSLVRMK